MLCEVQRNEMSQTQPWLHVMQLSFVLQQPYILVFSFAVRLHRLPRTWGEQFSLKRWRLSIKLSCIILLSITNKMQRYTIFFIVNTLHVSGGFSAHH